MKIILLTFYSISLFALISCSNASDREFTAVKDLSEFEKTAFIPTIEHSINADNNAVYCVTLLYAWDEIRNIINEPLEISKENNELLLLHQSTSYKDVLNSDEFTASGNVEGDIIKAKAEFNKSLPFEFKLNSYKDKLVFDNQKVASFGVNGYDEFKQKNIIQILYYKNDNNFIIKLLPKNTKHEIILFKSEETFSSMIAMNDEIKRLTEIGTTEKDNDNLSWKYYIAYQDVVIIPKFNFNIQTNYKQIEGTTFKSKIQKYKIETAWQRTAFILDEAGAEIESEAVLEVATEAMDEEYEEPKPKQMIFDKPFLLLLKRSDSQHPYFGLWTANAELMVKE